MARAEDRELLRLIYRMMAEGVTTTKIANHLGMKQSHVSLLAQKKNLNVAMQMMRLADEGETLEGIGKAFGVSKQRVGKLTGMSSPRITVIR